MPGRFDGNSLQEWTDQANNPASPSGLSQAATAAGGYQSHDSRFADSHLGQFVHDQGPTAQAQTWYTGRNTEGTRNGWNTDFWDRVMRQNEEVGREGGLNTQFQRTDATGVVSWDHDSTDGKQSFHFGDVFDNGKKVGNVYEQFDRQTANLMMADILLDKDTKARVFSKTGVDPKTGTVRDDGGLDSEIQRVREENNTRIPQALKAADFNENVKERAADFESGHVDDAITAGGAAGGAAIGAGIGTFVAPGLGTAIGAGIGALVGGVGAGVNKDALAEQAARAYEITSMSDRENGSIAGVFTGVQQWSGFGGRLISPLSNNVQGWTDKLKGKVGDGTSEFYRVDDKGDSTVSRWVKALDVGATVGDSLLQFASPVGRALYTTQMAGTIAGEVGELTTTGGKSFDYSRGEFDNIFTNEKGEFDPMRGAAGIGKVGIDFVQLGMARGLVGKTNALRTQVGMDTMTPGLSSVLERTGSKLPRWLGGKSAAEKEAIAAGGTVHEAAGFKFALDAEGKAVSRRASLSLLAPSEQLSALSARVIAARTAAKEGGAASVDDFYRATQAMASGEKKLQTAIVNAMGESYEEGVQQVLDPYSHEQHIDGNDIANAMVYGAAAGAGMGLGFNLHTPSAAQKLDAQVRTAYATMTGGAYLSDGDLKSMTEVQKRTLASMNDLQTAQAESVYTKIADDQRAEHAGTVAGVAKLADAVQSQLAQQLARGTDRTDGAFVITQIEDAGKVDESGNLLPGSMPSDAVASSGKQLAQNFVNRMRGAEAQLTSLQRSMEQVPADAEDRDVQIAAIQERINKTRLMLTWAQRIDDAIEQSVTRMYADDATVEEINAEAEQLNDLLRRAFNMQIDEAGGQPLTGQDKFALARAVSQIAARDPHDSAGSYQMLVPQVSPRLTAAKADNVLEISHAVLPALRGDYDGDKVRTLNQLMLDDNEFVSARAGAHFVGMGTSVNVGAPKYEKYIVEYLADALSGRGGDVLAAYATQTEVAIADAVRKRYADVVDDATLNEVLDDFFAQVRAGSKDARAALLDGLANKAGGEITTFARGNLTNEWLWLDQLIRANFQQFQEAYAANAPKLGPRPDTSKVPANRQTTDARERKAQRGATIGDTINLLLTGDQPFRQAQKLHYSSIVASVLSSEAGGARADVYELAQAYEALGQGLTDTELNAIRSKDNITARAYAQLERLSMEAQQLNPELGRAEALSVMANVRVLDIYDDEGNLLEQGGGEITLAQLLLKRELQRDKREKAAIAESSPELQAKWLRLQQMTKPDAQGREGSRVNASKAFVEIVGAQQMYVLLGDASGIFGPHLTVEQFIRFYSAKSEADRNSWTRKLKSDPSYGEREEHHNPPYDVTELKQITPFRAVVDAVLAVGNSRLTIDKEGKLHGELARRSKQTSRAFAEFHGHARRAIEEYLRLAGRGANETQVETIQRMLEANPDWARQLYNLIPNAAANAAIYSDGKGGVVVSNWFFDILATEDAAHAEMIYLRNLILAKWRAKAIQTDEELDDGEGKRRFDKLDSRFHRIMYSLHPSLRKDGGLMYQRFLREMESATSVEAFVHWVNTTPGVRGNQAPLTAWVDDVAEFDMDKASGGWTTALSGSELREAIGTLQKSTDMLVKDLAEERTAVNDDVATLAAIERALKAEAGTSTDRDSGDAEVLRQFRDAIDFAGKQMVGMGPQAMIYQTIGAARGFNAQSHTKGKNPPNVVLQGMFDALRDAFDYTTNFERLMASLTAQNIEAVGGNLSLVAKDGGRAMDDFGNTVAWQKPTEAQMLELLKNPDTRPLARAILFPQVMERTFDGRLSTQLLVGKSLRDLLTGKSHQTVFAADPMKLSNDQAFRYLAMIESEARNHGGHFSVQRAANDLVIARVSAADHVLTDYELEQMTVKAYREIAQVLQTTGSISADKGMQPGVDPLEVILAKVRETQKAARKAGVLGIKPGTDALLLSDTALDQLVEQREADQVLEINELGDLLSQAKDPAEVGRIESRVLALQADLKAFRQKVEALKSDDLAAHAAEMFFIHDGPDGKPDPAEIGSKGPRIVDFILDNLQVLQQMSASKITLNKLTNQLLDSGRAGQVDLTAKEWKQLSQAVTAVYVDKAASLTAANVSVPPFPDLDSEQGQEQARYYDTSFSYLVEPMLTSSSPLVKAAREIHRRAGRHGADAFADDVMNLLGRTIFADFAYGAWTGEIPRASIEANSRLLSAAAEAGISMPGDSPKRQAVISAATRRTFEVPGEELLSKVALTWIDLNKDEFDDIDVAHPDGQVRPSHKALLNNRFARNVMLRYADAEGEKSVDLLAEFSWLGRVFAANDAAATSGYQEIHLDRIRRAVDTFATQHNLEPESLAVDVDFFHPSDQPAEEQWYNNLFFEGTSFLLDADRHESLNATLWFANGSISPLVQAQALDASKLGKPALAVIETPPAADREAMEQLALTDLEAVLRAKAKQMLTTDLGFGTLEERPGTEMYNAVLKNLKLRHFVKTADSLLTAEQVIALQRAGQPVEGTLWIPSDNVLRSMLGEQGTKGVARVFDDQLDIDLSRVRTYRGVTPQMLERFDFGTAALHETKITNRARQQQLVVRATVDDKTRSAYEQKIRLFEERRFDIDADRSQMTQRDSGGFNPRRNLANAVRAGEKFLRAENIAFDWTRVVPFIGPRNPADVELSKMLLHELEATLDSNGYRSGWIYEESGDANAAEGKLSKVALSSAGRPGLHVAPGDLVVVQLDSFRGDLELAKKRLDWFAERGATVVLGSADGGTDLRAPLAEYLENDLDFDRLVGSVHVYTPRLTTPRWQNQRARVSTLTEMRPVSKRNQLAIFNTTGKPVEENAAWVNGNNDRLRSIAVSMNLVPVDFLAGYNVPIEQFADTSQVDRVRQHILGLNTPEGRTMLRDMANKHLDGDERKRADAAFDGAWERLLDRLETGGVLPQAGDEFGTGDFIPLVDQFGNVLLYRHGFKAPRRDQVEYMQAQIPGDRTTAANIAVFPSKSEPAATTHRGTVVRVNPRASYGLSMELDIPLQVFGDKKVLEWNGMKYVLAPMPDSIRLPEHGFFPGWGVDIVASLDDAMSKESLDGTVDNHRNAFAYFGIDFTADVAKFFDVDARTARELLNQIASSAPRISVAAADELLNADRLAASFREMLPSFVADGHVQASQWADRLYDEQTVEAQITRALVVYLMTPGAQVDDVIRSGGFNDEAASIDAQSILMPRLFTQVFDNAPLNSELRTEINNRLNAQVYNPNYDGTGYRLHQDWTFEILNEDPTKNMRGFLQFSEAHSSGDNPVKNGMAFDDTERGVVSQHSAAIAYQAIGADTAVVHDYAKARMFAKGAPVLDSDVADGGVWRMLTDVDLSKRSQAQAWRNETPAEAMRRDLAREAVVQFRQVINTEDVNGWSKQQRKEYGDLRNAIVRRLGMLDSQSEVVDFWVRQLLGMPHGTDENGNELGKVSGKAAIEAAKDIQWNVDNGYMPTIGAEVPLLHVHDLQAIYRANNTAKKWKPRTSMDADTSSASTWNEWVKVSLGSALTSDNLFDPMYLLALDGFMHSYQSATRDLLDLPVSVDTFRALELLKPETNDMVVSISDEQNLITMDPFMVDTVRASLDELIGGRRIAGKFEAKAAPASEVAKRREARRKWRKENGVPIPVDVTMKNFRKNGAEFVDHSTVTSAFARSLINLRVGTALINPALYVSMGPEQWFRGGLDRMANLITGQATVGASAGALSRASERISGAAAAGADRLADGERRTLGQSAGTLLEQMGLTYSYTPQQLKDLGQLYRVLGQRNDFKAMVYKDLWYLRPHEAGIGRVEKWLEGYAKLGSRMQDPTWGMKANTLARRYMEAALQHIMATPTLNTLTVDSLVANMKLDPTFLQKNYPEAHEAASNAIAQIRSLKPTVLSLSLRGIYEPLSESPNAALNFIGNTVFKLPLLFSGYAMNVLTTITGMQGLNDMTAMFLHGRVNGFKHPRTLLGRVQAKLRGEEFTPEDDELFDFSSVIEGIDLTRSFIRGGITHTGLFAFGMMAGGLGLSGEDDETRKRRRMAELQGAGFIYDPRRIENDFRNADSIFLDWLPFGLDSYFRVTSPDAVGGARSMGQLHWMLKQFISPMMGMEKFFETGDFRHVTWGFEDAVGSFPLINTLMWDDAVSTAHELAAAADDEAKLGGPQNLVASAGLLTNAVGVYERMLFENSFINQLYTSMDRYDRDPYVLPLRDSDGELQRDIEGNARSQDLATEQFIDPETGEVRTGYTSRDTNSAMLHSLTENRATMAFGLSLFTGMLDSDYLRRNMPIKQREIEKPNMSQDDAEAVIRAFSQAAGGQAKLDADELAQLWKNEAKAAGVYVDWSKLDAEAAKAAAAGFGDTGKPEPLSVLDKAAREHVTNAGAKAILQSLAKDPHLTPTSESLRGVYITFEMRNQIQKEWLAELKQEGLDMGLDETKANSRMNRIWYGPTEDPSVPGLKDLVWSKDIPFSDTLEYNQLNTTYVVGPDGRPWATGFTRDGVLGAMGLKPVKRAYLSESGAMGTDDRLNSTDLVNGLNTGLRALELVDDSRYIPTDVEIGKAIEDAIKEAMQTPMTPYANTPKSGSGYGGYGGRGYRRGGGGYGGYSGGGGYIDFTRMYALPHNVSPYGNDMSFINTSNPIIRRGDVRRERVWSERGRLKQWQ